MPASRKLAPAVIPLVLSLSWTGVSAPPSFADALETVDASAARKGAATASQTSASAAERIGKAADALAKQRLAAYVLARYADASVPTRERFAANFASVAKADPSAEIHPYYLVSLEKTIVGSPKLKEDGALFGAYAHVILSLRDSKADVTKMAEKRRNELPDALKEATLGKVQAKTEEERKSAFAAFAALKYDPWSSSDLSKMRQQIIDRKIGPETDYFKAYAFARSGLVKTSGNLSLLRPIPHAKQVWNLSCEANSMRDIVNYYRLGNREAPAEESAFVFLLPSDPNPPKYQNGVRIWADPEKTFVGRIDGKQSSNPQKLTGYGIHADGVLPYLRKELKRYGLKAEKRTFDSDAIRDSLAAGHPVFFWYVIGADPSRGFSRLDWKTPEGRDVTGFVGEHVGVIVGAKLGNDGSIAEVSYYEGRTHGLQTETFESLSRKAKWFDEAIYVSEAEKAPEPQKIRKKNVRTATSKSVPKS